MPREKNRTARPARNTSSADDKSVWQHLESEFLKKEADRRELERLWKGSIAKIYSAETLAVIERAWAGGFWDGEGHAAARQRGGEFNCSVDQEDRINLERFQDAVGGIGKISKLKRRTAKSGKKQFIYTWEITNQADLRKFASAIVPFLTTAKRAQLARALSVPIASALQWGRRLPDGAISAEVG